MKLQKVMMAILAGIVMLGTGYAAHAQVTSSTSSTTSTSTTGLPNTGAGGEAANNILMLVSTGTVALVGFTLLRKRPA